MPAKLLNKKENNYLHILRKKQHDLLFSFPKLSTNTVDTKANQRIRATTTRTTSRGSAMTKNETLQTALDALLWANKEINGWLDDRGLEPEDHPKIMFAVTAIKEALAQPEQEPAAWAEFDGEGGYHFRAYENNEDYAEQWDKRNPNHVGWVKPLYTSPPQRTWVGLTEQEQGAIMEDLNAHGTNLYPFAQAIEAKLKDKNT